MKQFLLVIMLISAYSFQAHSQTKKDINIKSQELLEFAKKQQKRSSFSLHANAPIYMAKHKLYCTANALSVVGSFVFESFPIAGALPVTLSGDIREQEVSRLDKKYEIRSLTSESLKT